MVGTRKLQIIALKSEALSLEEEEYEEFNSVCVDEFNKDFHLEVAYAHEANDNKENNDIGLQEEKNEDEVYDLPTATLKKIHKKLAMLTHPDLHPNTPGAEEEFKTIQEAYEQSNGPLLIKEILKRKISVSLTSREIFEIEEQLKKRRIRLQGKKSSCAWVWYNSDKEKGGLRERIRMSMGINETKFQAWIKNKID